MAGIRIGSLHVSLGIDTAQFSAGLAKARGNLATFGAAADTSFAALTAGATAAGLALGVAVKGAIDHADELSKAAQKAGLTVESLSRLEYAGKLSDVALSDLTASLGRLGKTMVEVSTGQNPAAKAAFDALGISVVGANGKLRESDMVFADVADRFARMENGATKTALSMAMFGKSGAALIPMLNSGRDGLAEMADEADRLGLTISTKTAQKAEQFNDTLTRVQESLQGVTNRIIADDGVMDGLQQLADALADPEFADAAGTLAGNIIGALSKDLIPFLKSTAHEIEMLKKFAQGDFEGMLTPERRLSNLRSQLGAELSDFNAGNQSIGAGANGMGGLGSYDPALLGIGADANGVAMNGVGSGARFGDIQKLFANMSQGYGQSDLGGGANFGEVQNFLGSLSKPFEPVLTGLGGVDKALEASKANMAAWAEAFDAEINDTGAAMEEMAARAEAAWSGTAGLVGDAFSTLASVVGDKTEESFELSKKLSMASSIVAGIEATMQAFKKGNELGGLPLGVLWGGIAAATAAAKVAAIGATTFDSTSMAGGAAAGGSAAPGAGAAPVGQTQGISINIKPGRYAAQDVADLVTDINSALGLNGKQLMITHINGG